MAYINSYFTRYLIFFALFIPEIQIVMKRSREVEFLMMKCSACSHEMSFDNLKKQRTKSDEASPPFFRHSRPSVTFFKVM